MIYLLLYNFCLDRTTVDHASPELSPTIPPNALFVTLHVGYNEAGVNLSKAKKSATQDTDQMQSQHTFSLSLFTLSYIMPESKNPQGN